jgi:hypothetical protein
MSRLAAISFACLMLAACEAPVTDESQLSPSVLDWCFFEATAPADATVEDIASEFQSNRRFCSWRSFSERKFVGQASGFTLATDRRKPSELRCGVPKERARAREVACDARCHDGEQIAELELKPDQRLMKLAQGLEPRTTGVPR